MEGLLHPFSSSSLFCQLAFGTVSLCSSSREENNTSDVILSSFERPGYSSFVVEKFFGCPLWSHLTAPYVLVPWEHSPLGSFPQNFSSDLKICLTLTSLKESSSSFSRHFSCFIMIFGQDHDSLTAWGEPFCEGFLPGLGLGNTHLGVCSFP